MNLSVLGKGIIFLGLTLAFIGGVLTFVSKIPFLGKFPGDILIKRDNFTFYFPLVTCLVLSILLTIILNFLMKR